MMSYIKKEEEPSSSNDPKNIIKALVMQFDNFLERDKERWEHFKVWMAEIERKQQPRRRDRRNNDEGEYEEFDGDGYDEKDEH